MASDETDDRLRFRKSATPLAASQSFHVLRLAKIPRTQRRLARGRRSAAADDDLHGGLRRGAVAGLRPVGAIGNFPGGRLSPRSDPADRAGNRHSGRPRPHPRPGRHGAGPRSNRPCSDRRISPAARAAGRELASRGRPCAAVEGRSQGRGKTGRRPSRGSRRARSDGPAAGRPVRPYSGAMGRAGPENSGPRTADSGERQPPPGHRGRSTVGRGKRLVRAALPAVVRSAPRAADHRRRGTGLSRHGRGPAAGGRRRDRGPSRALPRRENRPAHAPQLRPRPAGRSRARTPRPGPGGQDRGPRRRRAAVRAAAPRPGRAVRRTDRPQPPRHRHPLPPRSGSRPRRRLDHRPGPATHGRGPPAKRVAERGNLQQCGTARTRAAPRP